MSDVPKAAAGWYPYLKMIDTVRYWDGEQWTDHLAPASGAAADSAPAGDMRPCPYCSTSMSDVATRCPSCAGEQRVCRRCKDFVGMTSKQKFVGIARGGTKTQYRCMQCDKVLDGPRF